MLELIRAIQVNVDDDLHQETYDESLKPEDYDDGFQFLDTVTDIKVKQGRIAFQLAHSPGNTRPYWTPWGEADQVLLRYVDSRPCQECGVERRVVSTFTVEQRRDPTAAYKLDCGHSTIDL